ncbi:MAG: hypothetical protein GY849_13330 [Deltaproteobacteria bacterium]|nr:hypothetical protein [Deltaproteobacteria bacterium]
MTPSDLVIGAATVVPGVIGVIELFLRIPFMENVHTLKITAVKALKVIASPNISDYWKEKSVLCYAGIIMRSNLRIALYLAILVMAFGVPYCLIGFFFFENTKEVFDHLFRLETQIMAAVFGMLYGMLRYRLHHG